MAGIQELFNGNTIKNGNGEVVDYDTIGANQIIGIYFSAHWCPPCRQFTPLLAKKYLEYKASENPFEIIFVSSDNSPIECDEYFADMPWLCLDYDARDIAQSLGMKYGVRGIPSLILVNGQGELITTNGRAAIQSVPFEGLATYK
jgi:nucleoredoxin